MDVVVGFISYSGSNEEPLHTSFLFISRDILCFEYLEKLKMRRIT